MGSKPRVLLLTACLFLIFGTLNGFATKTPFNPREHLMNVVTCPAINRAENKQVDIDLRKSRARCGCERKLRVLVDYVDINPQAKKTLLFLHGWPSLWASWKHQIEEFQVQDCRV